MASLSLPSAAICEDDILDNPDIPYFWVRFPHKPRSQVLGPRLFRVSAIYEYGVYSLVLSPTLHLHSFLKYLKTGYAGFLLRVLLEKSKKLDTVILNNKPSSIKDRIFAQGIYKPFSKHLDPNEDAL